jgi:hypothetical protein
MPPMKKPSKSYDLKGSNSICISTGGERGTAIFQVFKNVKTLLIYKVSINSMLFEGF